MGDEKSLNQVKQALILNGAHIYGTGTFAQRIREYLEKTDIKFLGYLDSSENKTKGVTFKEPKKNEHEVFVILGFNNYLADIAGITNKLLEMKYQVVNVIEIVKILRDYGFAIENYWLTNNFSLYDLNRESIEKVKSFFSDELSVQNFCNIIEYRKTGNLEYLEQKSTIESQYFPNDFSWISNLRSRQDGIVVIDGGAFQGESAIQASEVVKIKRWVLVEPDEANHQKLIENVRTLHGKFDLIGKALGNFNGVAAFNAAQNSHSSRIESNGLIEIEVVKIDSLALEMNLKVDLIKLDVEGAEMSSLLGARDIILKQRPLIAVAIYHKPEDHWEIPLFLGKNYPNYSYYLRFHGEQSYDTILYCIPK